MEELCISCFMKAKLIPFLFIFLGSLFFVSCWDFPFKTQQDLWRERNEAYRVAREERRGNISNGDFAGAFFGVLEIYENIDLDEEWEEMFGILLAIILEQFSLGLIYTALEDLEPQKHDSDTEEIYQFFFKVNPGDSLGYRHYFSWLINRGRFEDALEFSRFWDLQVTEGPTENVRTQFDYFLTALALFFNQQLEALEKRAQELYENGLIDSSFFNYLIRLSKPANFEENKQTTLEELRGYLKNQKKGTIQAFHLRVDALNRINGELCLEEINLLEQWRKFRDWKVENEEVLSNWLQLRNQDIQNNL